MGEIVRKLLLLHGDAEGGVLEQARCDRCRHWGSQRKNMNCAESQECSRVQARTEQARLEDWDHGSGCGMFTSPDFGCALFEAREPA